MATLNTVFKQVFGEGLKEHGFVKIKGRQPYLVRVVGDEIIHVITCRNESCGKPGYKEFSILGGVATVYRRAIDLTITPSNNINWLNYLSSFYSTTKPMDYDNEYRISLMWFPYPAEDEEALYSAMKRALEETKKNALPVLDKVIDLESGIAFFRMFQLSLLNIYDYKKYVFRGGNDENEGLLYIQTDNHDDFKKELEGELANIALKIRMGRSFWSSYEEACHDMEKARLRRIALRDYIYNNPEVYAEAMEELERRKRKNTEALRSYGLDI